MRAPLCWGSGICWSMRRGAEKPTGGRHKNSAVFVQAFFLAYKAEGFFFSDLIITCRFDSSAPPPPPMFFFKDLKWNWSEFFQSLQHFHLELSIFQMGDWFLGRILKWASCWPQRAFENDAAGSMVWWAVCSGIAGLGCTGKKWYSRRRGLMRWTEQRMFDGPICNPTVNLEYHQ